MVNKDGKTVALLAEAFATAAGGANWEGTPGFRRRPHQRGGRRLLADHRRELHPHAQAAAGPGRRRRGAEILRLGLRQGRHHGAGTRLRAGAGRRRRRRARLWAAEIKDASGRPIYEPPR